MQIDRFNFNENHKLFMELLHSPKTEFVSFDFEMTGIRTQEREQFSDLPFERYDKCSQVGKKYNLIQAGLTIFHKEGEANYVAHPFNAFVFQQKIIGTWHKPSLMLEPGAIRFNARHGLDFNAWIQNGVNYLDRRTKGRLESQVQGQANISDSEKKVIYEAINEAVGFTLIFESLKARGVPLVGHNCYFDLIFLHQAFFGPLPAEYSLIKSSKQSSSTNNNTNKASELSIEDSGFKQNIHALLGNIYDSKTIANSHIKNLMPANDNYTSLEKIKEFIYSDLDNLRSVRVTLANGCESYDWDVEGNGQKFHEAGFDSYLTGWVYLQLRSLFIRSNYAENEDAFEKRFMNKVNVMNNQFLFTLDSEVDVRQSSVKVGLVCEDQVAIFKLNNVGIEATDQIYPKMEILVNKIQDLIWKRQHQIENRVMVVNKRYAIVQYFLEGIKDPLIIEESMKKISMDIQEIKGIASFIPSEQYMNDILTEKEIRLMKMQFRNQRDAK